MTSRASRANPTYIERIVTLEQKQERMDTTLDSIETMLKPIHEFFVGAKFVRWLVAGLIAVASVTAATVTATIGAIRFFTGQ